MESLQKLQPLSSQQLRILRTAAAVVGAGYLAKILLRELWRLSHGFCAYFLAPWGISRVDLRRYGEWAVVTGASEGIGRGYALELAKRGLNVVIMSRSQEKLQKVADEIKEKYGRDVRIIAVDFSAGQEIYPKIAEELQDLDVGILINNVGLSYIHPEFFLQVTVERLHDIVELNCQVTVRMTHLLLPRMLEKKRGIIVNLSTIGSYTPCALLTVYSASKVFIDYFSEGLRKEYGSRDIIVQNVMPNYVATAMSKIRRPTYFSPTPETYARAAVATIGVQHNTYGYWPHALQAYIASWFPKGVYRWGAERAMAKARQKLLVRLAREAASS